MERCANTEMLNKHFKKQEDRNISFDLFVESVDDDLNTIRDIVKNIHKRAESYDGYDFVEDIDYILEDLL